jgi:hypothetical protein
MNKKINSCSQHELCQSSDSQLAICLCWCAECKEIMADIRSAFGGFTADRIAIHATATARQLFTADGKLIKAGN